MCGEKYNRFNSYKKLNCYKILYNYKPITISYTQDFYNLDALEKYEDLDI